MRTIRHTALLLAPVAIAIASAAVAAAVQPDRKSAERAAQRAAYGQALDDFRGGRRAAAYGRLMPLADAGHVPSAQLALLMLRQGKALFGSEWSATETQQTRWNAHVINGARALPALVTNEAGD